MRFSQRIGKNPVRESLQIESIDDSLKNKLWNLLLKSLFERLKKETYENADIVCVYIWTEFFGLIADETPSFYSLHSPDFSYYFKIKFFNELAWYEIYDLIEFLAELDKVTWKTNFSKECNSVLKRELSGYRLINNKIVQTTSEEEIDSIETAIKDSTGMTSVTTHLQSALELLSNRENPDYRNSIKESISAVEAFCCNITGTPNASLGAALKVIERNYNLHKALKNAFSSLYGYTSDSGGIRHSLIEDDVSVTFDEAKFMLVSCSTFINYLKAKIHM